MKDRRTGTPTWPMLAITGVLAACGMPQSVWSQDATAGSGSESSRGATAEVAAGNAAVQPAPVEQPQPAPAGGSPRIRFTFKDAPFDQVLDFFSRQSGLPVIFEAKAPEGTCTYIGAGDMDLDGALAVLNQILLLHRVNLRRDGEFLYLADVKRAVAAGGPVFVGEIPTQGQGAGPVPAPADIVTLAIPLSTVKAEAIAEQVKKMIADYGAVTPIPGQNMLVIVETAAQAKRIQAIVQTIDGVRDVDSAYKVFKLTHAKPDAVFNSLKGLLGERQKTVVVDKDGNQRTINEVSVSGLSLQPDARTNSIIAVGSAARLEIVEELIALLDVPEAEVLQREVRTIVLRSVTPAAVAAKLNQLYSSMPGEQRPTVIPLDEQGKLTIVGSATAIAQGLVLAAEMDPALKAQPEGTPASPERVTQLVALEHVQASSVEPIVMRLASPREQQVVRVASAPNGRGLIVSGPGPEVENVRALIATLDVKGDTAGAGQVKVLPLQHADANQVAATIQGVLTGDVGEKTPAVVRVDPASNALVLRGSATQLAMIEKLAGDLDRATGASSRQMRLVPIDRSKGDAGAMARTLERLVKEQGGVRVEVVTLEELLKRTRAESDPAEAAPRPSEPAVDGQPAPPQGMIPEHDARRLAPAWMAAIASAVVGAQPEEDGVVIAVDEASNSLVVVGSQRATDRLAALASQVQVQIPPEPTKLRLVDLPTGTDPWSLTQIVNQAIGQLGRLSLTNPGGFTGNVAITPDPTGSTLIVWANDTDFATIGEVLSAVSKPGGAASQGEITIKVYPLTGVAAWSAVQSVRDLLANQPRGAQARAVRTAMAFTLKGPDGEEVKGAVDPARVRITSDPGGTSLIVAAPAEAIPMIDRFIELIDQSPTRNLPSIRRYTLRHAQASDLSGTMQRLFDAQRQGAVGWREGATRPQFLADVRTNTILVTASEAQHAEVTRLVASMDESVEGQASGLKTTVIALERAEPAAVRQLVESLLIGRDAAKRERVRIGVEEGSGLMIVRAGDDDLAEVQRLVKEIEGAMTPLAGENGAAPAQVRAGVRAVRTLKVERADAQAVASTVQKFLSDRAQSASRGGRRNVERLAVIGDRRSGTIAVWATEPEFVEVQSLVATLDLPARNKQSEFRVIALKHARTTDIDETIRAISWEMQWERMTGVRARGGAEGPAEEQLLIETNDRTNSVVLFGQGEALELASKIIAELDVADPATERPVIKAVGVPKGDLNVLAGVVRETMRTPGWYEWRGPDPQGVRVEVDAKQRKLVLVGKAARVEEATGMLRSLAPDQAATGPVVESITLKHAQAWRASDSLRRFFAERAQAMGLPEPMVSAIGSNDGNMVILSATGDSAESELKLARELLSKLDQPELGENRRVDLFALRNAKADEAIRAVQAMFPASGRSDDRVLVTTVGGGQSLAISTPADKFEQVEGLLKLIDAPPKASDAKIATVKLKTARASEVAQALAGALPASLSVKVTPVVRNNTLLLTGSDEAVGLVMERIAAIDDQPVVSLEFRRVALKHAVADDAVYTLRRLLQSRPRNAGDPEAAVDYSMLDNTVLFSGTPEQLKDIEQMLASLDVASTKPPRTEFVKLEFAKAEPVADALKVFYGRYALGAKTPGSRNVTIVPDPASNSLVVSADIDEWVGIRELLKKLDTEEYDTSRQLAVISLKHADATSVARSLAEGFRAPIEDRARREQMDRQREQQRRLGQFGPFMPEEPPVLVDAESAPTVTAEVQTNSLVVFAGQREMKRIRALVEQIDQASFAKLPDASVISVRTGRATLLAQTIREALASKRGGGVAGPRAAVVIGDDAADALVVRADERDLAEIRVLAESLQQQGAEVRPSVRTLKLSRVPAGRLQRTLQMTFGPQAQADGETLAIEVERGSNALVIASSPRLFEAIERVVKEIDGGETVNDKTGEAGKGGVFEAGGAVTVIELAHTSPEQMKQMLEQLGASRGASDDRPGIVREPVVIQALATRRAIAVVAGPGDAEAIASLVKTLDAEPLPAGGAEQVMVIVPVKQASAAAVAATLRGMLNPAQASESPPARAIAEHLRRLTLQRPGAANGEGELSLDLTKPIRLLPDAQTNSIIVSSTAGNVASLRELVKSLDALPIGDAVVVRFFPLMNASCVRVKGVVDDLFRQGEELRRLPGTDRRGLPTTATGRALAGEIAVTLDERTNAVIVAGREEAVAFVEVLVQNLDSADAGKWVEPRVVRLKHADPVRLAQQLNTLLIQRTSPTPEAQALQRQVARLRVAKQGGEVKPGEPADKSRFAEADLFAPMAGVVIEAQPEMRALVVVATPANLEVVSELVAQLDVESASPANSVRVFPLERASADRVSASIQELFRQREGSAAPGTFLPEDKLSITADPRTNSLIVSTSVKSLAIVEALVKTLDGEQSNPTVSVHVVPVPGGDVNQLAPKIGRLMRERLAAQQQTGAVRSAQDVFSIEADAANNVLVVACSEENLAIVKELVGTLSASGDAKAGQERRDLIQLTKGRAEDIAQVLQQVYVAKETAKRGAGAVSVVSNDRLNALIVTGTADDVEKVRQLAAQVESSPVMAEQVMKRIRLRSANANEVVTVLREMLSGRGNVDDRPGAPRQAVRIKYLREAVSKGVADVAGRVPTEAQLDGLVRELVSLAPDLRSNSVMVTAPTDVMTLVEEIVADLDTTELDRQIKLFPLKNADARATAELLRDVFSLRQQGNQYVLVPTGQPVEEEVQFGPSVSGTTFTPVVDQRQQLSIAIDARTNTLVVSGTQEYLDRVGTVIHELDGMEAAERDRIVYHLRNARAKEAETTLKSLFSGESALQRELLGPDQAGSVMRQLEQEVTVVGDEKSNKLLITVSPRYADRVMELVQEIDSAPPQVTIQVLLAEVTVDSSNTWGMDWKLRDITGANVDAGFLGAGAGVAAALGVPNLSFSSADFEILVRALEVQGKLQVLSRPSVTANNNERAEINVGENVAVVTDVERLDNGNTRANIERRDLGITLNVTPTISADGFVRMELEPSISAVSQRSTQVSEDFSAPIFTQRKVKTTVTVKDGQTVVIGGLIETKQEERRTKVPLLGDVPGVGEIFKSSKAEDVKTELLVILTPRVIYNDRGTGVSTFRNLSEQQLDAFTTPQDVREMMQRDGMYEPPMMMQSPTPPDVDPPLDATFMPLGESPSRATDGSKQSPVKSGSARGGGLPRTSRESGVRKFDPREGEP